MIRSRDKAFVGRFEELFQLEEALALARTGEPTIVVVRGAPGIGKTALLRRFARGFDGDVRLLWAQGDEAESRLSFGLANQLLAQLPEEGGPPATAAADSFSIGERLLTGVSALEREVSSVLVLDDLDLADVASGRALSFCLRRLRDRRVLVLVSLQPEGLEALDAGWARLLLDRDLARWIELEGLPTTGIGALATATGLRLSPAALAHLCEHTEGNPRYARALLEELPAETLNDEFAELPAPRVVTGAVRTRLAEASADTRDLVHAAAVIGVRSRLDLAAAVADVVDPEACADEAGDLGLLHAHSTAHAEMVEFPSRLLRTAVYQALSRSQRRRLHLSAAALVTSTDSYRHRFAAARGGTDEGLAGELTALARGERDTDRPQLAVEHLHQAAVLDPDPERSEARLFEAVEIAVFAGHHGAARRFTDAVAARPESLRRRYTLGLLDIAERELGRATKEFEAVMGQAGEHDAGLLARCAAARGLIAGVTGDGSGAMRWAALVRESSAPANLKSFATLIRAWEEARIGRISQALRLLDATPAAGRRPGPFQTDTLAVRGIVRGWAGRLAEARADLETVAEWVRRGHHTIYTTYVYAALADIEFHEGRWHAAATTVERAISVARELDEPWFLPYAHAVAARLYAATGEDGLAAANATAAQGVLPRAHTGNANAYAALATAEHAWGVADWETVRSALDPLERQWGALTPEPPAVAGWRALLAEAHLSLGQPAQARRVLDEMAPSPWPDGAGARQRLEARYWQALGDPTRAGEVFAQAYARIRKDSASFAEGLLCLDYGRHLLLSGDRSRAEEPLWTAHAAFERLGALKQADECHHVLAASGIAPGSSAPAGSLLTPREQVVATLVSTGMTNRQVAAELYLSVKAVEYHLGNIFRKLGIDNRRHLRRALVGHISAAGDRSAQRSARLRVMGEQP